MRVFLLLLGWMAATAQADLMRWPATRLPPADAVVVDVRALEACTRRSVASARCLPAADFLDARGALPPWREIVWLLSTARLTGAEHVVVIGDQAEDRHLVAGLMELAGQRSVAVVETPVTRLFAAGWPAGQGLQRDFARQLAYTAPMRESSIVLPREAPSAEIIAGRDARDALHRWVSARLAGEALPIFLGGRS